MLLLDSKIQNICLQPFADSLWRPGFALYCILLTTVEVLSASSLPAGPRLPDCQWQQFMLFWPLTVVTYLDFTVLTHESSDVCVIQLGEQLSLFYNPFFRNVFLFKFFRVLDRSRTSQWALLHLHIQNNAATTSRLLQTQPLYAFLPK